MVDPFIPWWLAALCMSVMGSAYLLISQQTKLRSDILVMWRGFGVALVALPFVLMQSPPEDPWFYFYTISIGLFVGYFDFKILRASALFNAGVVTRVKPILIISVFVLWYLLNPTQFWVLVDETPLKFAAIVGLLGLGSAALYAAQKNSVSREALVYLMPVLVMGGIVDVFNKSAMVLAPYAQAVVYYMFIVGFCAGFGNLVQSMRKKTFSGTEIFSKNVVLAGLMVVVANAGYQLFKNYGMIYTPNPAYMTLIGFCTPFWVMGYNAIGGVKDKGNVKAELVFLASVLCLIWITA